MPVGLTIGTPAVRPFRSSRTRNRFPHISYCPHRI